MVSSFWPATSSFVSAALTSSRDDTLFALVDGTVRFERVGKSGKKCSVKQ
jgi:ribosomal protein L27